LYLIIPCNNYGHVERKEDDDGVKACAKLTISGKSGRGRPTRTWKECVKGNMKRLGLKETGFIESGLFVTV
jgi:hypothetical protein